MPGTTHFFKEIDENLENSNGINGFYLTLTLTNESLLRSLKK